MKIAIKTPYGDALSWGCEETVTVSDFRGQIDMRCRLFKGGVFLKTHLTLAQRGVVEGDILRAAKAVEPTHQ